MYNDHTEYEIKTVKLMYKGQPVERTLKTWVSNKRFNRSQRKTRAYWKWMEQSKNN